MDNRSTSDRETLARLMCSIYCGPDRFDDGEPLHLSDAHREDADSVIAAGFRGKSALFNAERAAFTRGWYASRREPDVADASRSAQYPNEW